MEILTNGVITAREAFDAMMVGKLVVCRKTGNPLLGDYTPIKDFAADIFTNSEFEFAIQIETVTVAGIEFTKPFTLDELKDGDLIYVIDTTGEILTGQFSISNADLVASVKNGFAQRNEENAIKQIKAWRKTIGLNFDLDINVKGFDFAPRNFVKMNNLCNKAITPTQVQKALDQAKPKLSRPKKDPPSVEPDLPAKSAVPLWREYKDKITACKTHTELKTLETEILASNCIKQETDKLTIKTIINLIAKTYEAIYQKDFGILIEKVQQAHTADEVNGVVNQTMHWSIEQRAPLLKAINARLVHLQKIKEQPSEPANEDEGLTLAMRISRAESLEELDQLQLEVNALDPIIHSRFKELMDVRKEQLAKAQEA